MRVLFGPGHSRWILHEGFVFFGILAPSSPELNRWGRVQSVKRVFYKQTLASTKQTKFGSQMKYNSPLRFQKITIFYFSTPGTIWSLHFSLTGAEQVYCLSSSYWLYHRKLISRISALHNRFTLLNPFIRFVTSSHARHILLLHYTENFQRFHSHLERVRMTRSSTHLCFWPITIPCNQIGTSDLLSEFTNCYGKDNITHFFSGSHLSVLTSGK